MTLNVANKDLGTFEMPFDLVLDGRPTELGNIGFYVAPETLGHSEWEEVAARLLMLSIQSGHWCGQSVAAFGEALEADCQAKVAPMAARRRNADKADQHARAVNVWRWHLGLSLGLNWLFFESAPNVPEYEAVPPDPGICTLVPWPCAPYDLLVAAAQMVELGLLHTEKLEDDTMVMFPTAKLLGFIRNPGSYKADPGMAKRF